MVLRFLKEVVRYSAKEWLHLGFELKKIWILGALSFLLHHKICIILKSSTQVLYTFCTYNTSLYLGKRVPPILIIDFIYLFQQFEGFSV